ncbi:hypothetical protein [Hyalangium gracile]|uniref:hypothetical protein n=1 Tax=Hyalangium gracile TaxID=394092 RepID=UPI001CCD6A5B|nr:hypothetical protein [Hyalangium gracile]
MQSKSALCGVLLVSSLWTGSALANDTFIDIISPSTCVMNWGKLTQCSIAPKTLQALPFDTAVPMRTVIRRSMTGNCSTQYPLEVTLTPAGESGVKYPYISMPEVIIRGLDRQLLTSVQLADSSPWTRHVVLSDTCRISLQVQWNQVDVDTAEQAMAILQKLETDLATKKVQRDSLGYLVEFSSGFVFMRELANSFFTQLTTESIQALRAQAVAAGPIIFKTSMGCDDGTLTQVEKDLLAEFYFLLPTLGEAGDWTNPDGSPKTLLDFLGPEAKPIIDKLAARSTPEALAQYEADYQAAVQQVAHAEAKLAQARTQLAEWL